MVYKLVEIIRTFLCTADIHIRIDEIMNFDSNGIRMMVAVLRVANL